MNYIKNILIYIMTGLLSISNVYKDNYMYYVNKNVYNQVANTCVYSDINITPNELYDIMNYYNMLPSGIMCALEENNISIYLENINSISEFSKDYLDGVPLFIEKDTNDIKNLKIVELNNLTYLLYHGIYIGPIDDNTLDWKYWTEKYLVESEKYGKNYFYYENNSDNIIDYGYIEEPLFDGLDYIDKGNIHYFINNNDYKPEYILHEIGLKVCDLIEIERQLENISLDNEWVVLYNENKSIMGTIDDLSSIKINDDLTEGFAEAFRLTIQYDKKFEELCPNVYNYIYNILLQFNNKVNLDNFNYKGYADRYIDLRTAFGYNKECLYNHYLEYGLVEKRIG